MEWQKPTDISTYSESSQIQGATKIVHSYFSLTRVRGMWCPSIPRLHSALALPSESGRTKKFFKDPPFSSSVFCLVR